MKAMRLGALALWLIATGAMADQQLLFLDPVTGEFREPTAEDWAQLPRPKAAPEPVQAQVLPNGTILLPASAVMHEMTATILPDGRLQTDCDDHPASSAE
jgi:hypothetical protein